MRSMTRLAFALSLSVAALNAQAANVLVVLSDSDHLDLKDGKVFSTGFYLNELMQPVKLLLDAGHTVTFATPTGKAPTLDRSSDDKMYFNNDVAALQTHKALLEQLKITSPGESPVISLSRVEQVGYEHFDAVYIPGGHAPMQDLLHSQALGKLLNNFHQTGKTTALVCHGPIALLSTLTDPTAFTRQLETGKATTANNWTYAGYTFTVISNQEEEIAKGLLNGGAMKFYPQTALEKAGGVFSSNTAPWASHVVVDRELVTGQNPASALAVGKTLVDRLK
ncbi:type 1 glutamine amidotransferase domain-containing protein [Pseudomonas fluorescens]|uniref:Putative ThiJ/PfpI family protein n=1 Tax=Pseudomonas fluorescens (strain Pf0-1) TaxID=205922 RepID=Q3KDH9_PSEPF|nr:type 1 glutamine amidotransferase domain-containing protein [Pseudomonas fluorescens]ABA74176.1 Putative ThiJ/PfpI family protein [Pseudomonas fluorescens Pf0-1]MBY9026969.1 type 1 glutamine amidotransferase domain-containing protein [Pseudomonas fluorescens]MBY9033289.1 type 1 glutamine amidotransferase domain-containing protein [Pseudomonas fluorescens]MBY9038658.1 type 1 glutamine amidotransferase domain-containing protein [Pseudomonas fluorescens]MBY9041213.1 type 1 glutamine amidotrans